MPPSCILPYLCRTAPPRNHPRATTHRAAGADARFLTTDSARIGQIRTSEHCAQTGALAVYTLSPTGAQRPDDKTDTEKGTGRDSLRETEQHGVGRKNMMYLSLEGL